VDDVRALNSPRAGSRRPSGAWARGAVLGTCLALVGGFLLVAQPAASAPIGEADHVPELELVEGEPPPPGTEGDAPARGDGGKDKGQNKSENKAEAAKDKKPDARPNKKKDKSKDDVPLPPPPAVPAGLPATVDPLPTYQGQYICDPATKPGTARVAALIRATYADSRSIWVPRDCSVGGRSEHKEGRALDWMINSKIPAQKAQADSFLRWLLATDSNGNPFAMARRLGVMYIGWGDEIWESYRGRWSELKGCYSTQQSSFDTYCHRDHIHISFSWDGAAGQTSFWGGSPTPAPFCTASRTPATTPADPGTGLDFVPMAAQRILDTRSGVGNGGRPCRLAARSSGGAGAPLIIDVANRKGSPGARVKAVAIRVTTLASNSPATLRSSANGALKQVTVNGKQELVSILPVATDGTIALTTDSGATHVTVDLLGYFVTPGRANPSEGRLLAHANQVVYDTAALNSPLQPGEKRVVDVAIGATADGPPAGALLTVGISGAERNGRLMLRRPGDKHSPAAPTITYRRAAASVPVIAALDAEGRVLIVNSGKGTVDVSLAVQASAVRTPDLGALLVPVQPVEVRRARTTLTRLLPGPRVDARDGLTADTMAMRMAHGAAGATAAVLRVSATAVKGGEVTFFSLAKPATPSLVVPKQAKVTGLIVVPLDSSGTLRRDIVGGLNVTAHVVAYLR
jgi:hypothetical protein